MLPADTEANAVIALALGRIFRLGSRPTQPGDVREYERCRALIIEAAAAELPAEDWRPNFARDRTRGAAGD